MHTALIVIDAQQTFKHTPYWSESDLPEYLARQQELIDGCVRRGVPVVQIFHVDAKGPFAQAALVRTLDGLTIDPAVTFRKQVHSALAGTGLMAWLIARGITRLIISGIRTEQCCETTTRQAADSGFKVDFVTEATLTFPMRHARSGNAYTAAQIRERTELVLEGRFARIVSVAEALSSLDGALAKAA
ncbi:MAG: hydrolase [Massilia sp.]|nr:hydrolase [Massilia sp.]